MLNFEEVPGANELERKPSRKIYVEKVKLAPKFYYLSYLLSVIIIYFIIRFLKSGVLLFRSLFDESSYHSLKRLAIKPKFKTSSNFASN